MKGSKWSKAALVAISAVAMAKPTTALAADSGYGLYGRFELINNSTDVDTPINVNKYTKFRTWYPGVNFNSQIAPNIKFNFDMYLTTMTENADGIANNVNTFNIEYSLSEATTIAMGKIWYAAVGGWENDNAVVDVYQYSLANWDYSPANYLIGAAVSHTVANQTFKVAVVNPNNSGTASKDFDQDGNGTVTAGEGDRVQNQKKLGYAASYYGSFMEGKIQPLLSIISLGTTEQKNALGGEALKSVNNTYLAAGLKFKYDTWTLDVDHLANKLPDQTPGGSADETITSEVVSFKYKMDKFTPFVKFVLDNYKQEGNTAGEYKRTIGSLGLEYNETEHLRFHAVYTNLKTDYKDDTVKDTTDNVVLVGMSLNFKSK